VSGSLSLAAFPHYCTDPDVTWGNGRGALVVHYWADLQSMHGFRCYDNVAPNTKCQQVLALAVCLIVVVECIYQSYVFSHQLSAVDNTELMMVQFAADRPSTFSDG